MNTDKVTINWQNFTRVQIQLKFAFIIRPINFYQPMLSAKMAANGIQIHARTNQNCTLDRGRVWYITMHFKN